jgi:hypothetical protein
LPRRVLPTINHVKIVVVSRRRLLIAAVLACSAVAALLVAISVDQPFDPHGGITRSAAIALAQTHVDPGASSGASAVVRHDVMRPWPGGRDIHLWVWLVTFRGQWELMCAGSGCSPTTEWVAIDYYTGAWMGSEYTYPSG